MCQTFIYLFALNVRRVICLREGTEDIEDLNRDVFCLKIMEISIVFIGYV